MSRFLNPPHVSRLSIFLCLVSLIFALCSCDQPACHPSSPSVNIQVVNNVAYVGYHGTDANGDDIDYIYALRAGDGKTVWHMDKATLRLVDDNIVYATIGNTSGSSLVALSAGDGKQLWQFGAGGVPVTVVDSVVYVVTDHLLYALQTI